MGELAKQIYALRTERKLSQEQLAKELNTTRSRIAMWEQGKRNPNFEMQGKISKHFNVDMNYLHGINNVKKTSLDNLFELLSNVECISCEGKKRIKTYIEKVYELEQNKVE